MKDWFINKLGRKNRVNFVCISSKTDKTPASSKSEIEHYGGYLIAESLTLENAEFIISLISDNEKLIEALELNKKCVYHLADVIHDKIELDTEIVATAGEATHRILDKLRIEREKNETN